MRTEQFELSDETLEMCYNLPASSRAEVSHFYITDSGLKQLTRKASSTRNLISTFISKIEFFSWSLSSQGAKRLNVSYWICMALCCITFFTSHWSIFLAFLIPALVMNHMRLVQTAWKKRVGYHCGLSTNGT